MTFPTSSPAAPHDELAAVLDRLVSEWREARAALGLSHGAPWSQVARRLELDRGTAQRLVRMGRFAETGAEDLVHVPGPQGWQRVLAGVERALGAQHAVHRRLSAACERYGKCLAALGGSKAAALRAISPQPGHGHPRATAATQRARKRWFEAAVEGMGYRIETRIGLMIVRPCADDPERLDLATLHAFFGCTGSRGALPFALTRFATKDGVTPVPGSAAPESHAFVTLQSGTSTPPPALLFTGDAERQTVFIEPTWSESPTPLDVSLLQVELSASPSPWANDPPLLILNALNRHPVRRYVKQTLLHPDVERGTVARLAAYRDLAVYGQTRHWFDRLPEPARLEPFRLAPEPELEGLPRFADLIAELRAKLDWDLDGFLGHRAVLEHPIPLARYAIEYERQPA